MSPELQKRIAYGAGAVIVLCTVFLLADAALTAVRAPKDERLIKALQQQVKTEAALAPKLAGEQKRITNTRIARRTRNGAIAWLMIAAAAVFLTSAKAAIKAQTPAEGKRGAKARGTEVSLRRKAVPASKDEIDCAFVDSLVERFGRTSEAAIPILQAIQSHYRYLPDEALRRVCELTEITPAQLAGTSSFYGQFRRSPVGKHVVRVCHGTACHVAGARQVTDELRRFLEIPPDSDTDPSRTFTLDEVACLGCCSLAPVMMVDDQTAGRLTPAAACEALQPYEHKETA